jgi:hypothetical protein
MFTTIRKLLLSLIEGAKGFGLQRDIDNANDYLEYHEYGLCFEIIVTQLYEHEIKIDQKYFLLISKIGENLKLPLDDYVFMKELVTE